MRAIMGSSRYRDFRFDPDGLSPKPLSMKLSPRAYGRKIYHVTPKQEAGRVRQTQRNSGYNECSSCSWPYDQCVCVGTSYAVLDTKSSTGMPSYG